MTAYAQKARAIDQEIDFDQSKIASSQVKLKMDKPESDAEKHKDLNVKYVNDYHLTEKGEVIKIAAVVSPHRNIRE